MWDVYSSYAAPEAAAEGADKEQPCKFSLAGAWGGLPAAQQQSAEMAADEPASVRSIFDLWKGPAQDASAEPLPLTDTPASPVAVEQVPEEAISVFGVWGDFYNKPPPQIPPAEPAEPSKLSGLWSGLRASTQKPAKADPVAKSQVPATPQAEISLFNAWSELYTGQALLEPAQDEQTPLLIAPDPILHPMQHPSAFCHWGDVLQAGMGRLTDTTRPHAYMRQRVTEGVDQAIVGRRKPLLASLEQLLKGQRRDQAVYRQVVAALAQRASDKEHDAVIACARDYYYFWLGDLRYRPCNAVGKNLTIRGLEALKAAPFLNLLKRMRQETMLPAPPSLSIYLGQLHENGRSDSELESREQLLKAILFFLHDKSFVPSCYRRAVDALLMYISWPEERASVVKLAREFFYYWIAFPPAAVRNEVFL